MPVTDAVLWLHGTSTTPTNIFTSTSATGDEGDYVLDFGAAAAGTSTPYLPEFPSRTEAGYTFPPEVLGEGGMTMGVHLVIGTACTAGSGMTAGNIIVSVGSTDSLGTTVVTRTLTLAQLAVAGAHYFVPVPGAAVAANRYLGVYFQATTYAAGAGTGYAWYGPKTGGEQ